MVWFLSSGSGPDTPDIAPPGELGREALIELHASMLRDGIAPRVYLRTGLYPHIAVHAVPDRETAAASANGKPEVKVRADVRLPDISLQVSEDDLINRLEAVWEKAEMEITRKLPDAGGTADKGQNRPKSAAGTGREENTEQGRLIPRAALRRSRVYGALLIFGIAAGGILASRFSCYRPVLPEAHQPHASRIARGIREGKARREWARRLGLNESATWYDMFSYLDRSDPSGKATQELRSGFAGALNDLSNGALGKSWEQLRVAIGVSVYFGQGAARKGMSSGKRETRQAPIRQLQGKAGPQSPPR